MVIIVGISITILVALILFVGKKCCDIAIKPEIAEKYSNLVFTPEQKAILNKTHEEGLKWLAQNGEEVEIISYDGLKLKGYEIKVNPESDKWVIAVHGYMGKGADMASFVEHFNKLGYNGLIVDLRGHGKSEGKYIGMGWLDHYDLQIWIDKIIEENNNCEIVLYGISIPIAP